MVAHLTFKVIMLKTLGSALLQLAHPGGLLQFLRENLVQFNSAPLDDLPLDLRRGFLMSDQKDALELTLAQLMQLLQEDTTVEEVLATLQKEFQFSEVCKDSNKLKGFSQIIIFYFTERYNNLTFQVNASFCRLKMIYFFCPFKGKNDTTQITRKYYFYLLVCMLTQQLSLGLLGSFSAMLCFHFFSSL